MPGGEVLLQQLVEETYLIGPAILVEHRQLAGRFQQRFGACMLQVRQCFVEGHHHLLAVAAAETLLHGVGERLQASDQRPAPRQIVGVGPRAAGDALAIAGVQHAVAHEQRVSAGDLALQRAPDKTREQGGALAGDARVVGKLVAEQLEEVGRAVEIEQALIALNLGPGGVGMIGGVKAQELLDLWRGHRLHAHLPHIDIVLDAQGFAVVEAATRKHGAVAGREVVAQEAAPVFDALAKVVRVAVRHFVERIEQQQDAAFGQQRFQLGQARRLPLPLRFEPVERARRVPCRLPVEWIRAERYEERNLFASLRKTLAGLIKLQAAEQGGLAATGGAEEHHRPLGNVSEDIAQVGVVLLPFVKLQGVLAAHHVQQPQTDETGVDLVAFRKLAQQRLAIVDQRQARGLGSIGGASGGHAGLHRERSDHASQVIVDMGLANRPMLCGKQGPDVVRECLRRGWLRGIDQERKDRDSSLDRGPDLAAYPIVFLSETLVPRFFVLDHVPVLPQHDDQRRRLPDLDPELLGEVGARGNALDVQEDPLGSERHREPRRDRIGVPAALQLATVIDEDLAGHGLPPRTW
ncbi:MAG: hypothetical protein CAPSK01_002915 [Candidatus Accumulibacter vicinus]|uniref:Uncharacterized protein n=1 Tax=Candidatus Accumulibacter vicinus TaxID=2954382 RepID=A0A084XYD0_9PROT|nr:MAG: hypothetical protein CAPSK01_002915 [Candidatus Accumulibacter vicinus]